jgi:hypothetical protein
MVEGELVVFAFLCHQHVEVSYLYLSHHLGIHP